jgi:hypothetical protein
MPALAGDAGTIEGSVNNAGSFTVVAVQSGEAAGAFTITGSLID